MTYYYITTGSKSICYVNNDNVHVANAYKWGDNTDCYKWAFSYAEAKSFIQMIYNFAVNEMLADTSPEWDAQIIVRPYI